jgi:hypothetical protein
MASFDKPTKIAQLLGTLLAIPAGLAGSYAVFRSIRSGGVDCTDLRASIIGTMEKKIAPDAKRTLLRHDVESFDVHCGDEDPEARVVFDSALASPQAAPSARPPDAVADGPGAIFGLSRSGERRGWVTLLRHGRGGSEIVHFDGFAISTTSLPPAGTLLQARQLLPVWLEPYPGPNDPSRLQGRIAPGACVKVLSTRSGTGKTWAEVAPEACER